jgi:hypothetical protein
MIVRLRSNSLFFNLLLSWLGYYCQNANKKPSNAGLRVNCFSGYRKERIKQSSCLTVLPEGIVAFGAAQKLSGGFVCTSCLHLPDVSRVVAAFWAFNPDSGQRPQLLLFLPDNGDKLLGTVLNNFSHFWRLNLLAWVLLVSVLGADKN